MKYSNKHVLGRIANTFNKPMKSLIGRKFQRGMKCCRRVCDKIKEEYRYYYYYYSTIPAITWDYTCFTSVGDTSTIYAYMNYTGPGTTTYTLNLYDYYLTTSERWALYQVYVWVHLNDGTTVYYQQYPWPNGFSDSLLASFTIGRHESQISYIEVKCAFQGSEWSYDRWLYITPCA